MDIEHASAILKLVGEFISSVGLPVALVVVAVFGVFLTGKFLGPIIRAHSEKHLEFVDSVKDSNTKQTSILEAMSQTLATIAEAVLGNPKPPRSRK